MKKQLFRLITVVLLVVLVLAMAQVAVYAKEKSEISLLKTSEESYIIYVKDILSTDFLFSFSDDLETAEEDLIFSASGLDSNESNIAYMTKEQAESLNNAKTYMWVNINEEIQTYEINLNEAITVEEIAFVNTTTKRIQANAVGEENVSQYVEGVKITHSQGKINITEQGNAFSYHMVKVSDSETTNFVELANQIINSDELTNYERVSLVRKFSNAYNTMYANIENWEEVPENKEILQPKESKKNDIYLVWLKNTETQEHDVQILICDDYQDIEVEEAKKVTIYETTKLPVTFDSIITLIIILVVLVALIIALIVAKKKLNKKED